MKRSLILSSLLTATPAFVLFAFGPIAAVGLISIGGTLGILVCDYNSEPGYQRELSHLEAKQPLPLAA